MIDTEKNWDFDKWSENYDETVLDENWIHNGYSNIINIVAHKISDFVEGKPIRLLDIGAGTGNLISQLMKHKNIEFFAIEPSNGMREKLIKKCTNVKIIDGMLPELPDPVIKFDIIVSTYVIHHVQHNQTTIMVDNICKYANKNCLVIFADVMFESEKAFNENIKELKNKNMTGLIDELEDEYFQYIDVLKEGFQSHGFFVETQRRSFYTHIFHALR